MGEKSENGSFLLKCVASGVAGLIGRLVCHPFDTIKAKLQVSESTAKMAHVARSTWKAEGLRGFYPGIVAVAAGGIPGVCIYITTYEQCKAKLQDSHMLGSRPFLTYLFSGLAAEAACCLLFIPVDVVKERLQVQTTRNFGYRYSGSWDAVRSILRQEGVAGLYKGYMATLFSFGPFSAIYFWIFEEMKTIARRINGLPPLADLGFMEVLLSSAAAGSCAAFVTNPLDIAKLRYQVQRSLKTAVPPSSPSSSSSVAAKTDVASSSVQYRNLMHALRSIAMEHGIRGLFRGATARILFHVPSTAITMACYESTLHLMENVYN